MTILPLMILLGVVLMVMSYRRSSIHHRLPQRDATQLELRGGGAVSDGVGANTVAPPRPSALQPSETSPLGHVRRPVLNNTWPVMAIMFAVIEVDAVKRLRTVRPRMVPAYTVIPAALHRGADRLL